jgi:hypothetical protein
MNGYNCRSCGANLNPSQSTCDYCGSPYQEVSVVSIDVGVDFDEELRGLKFITEHPLFPTLASFMRASGSWSYLILDHLKLLDEALSKIRTIDRHKFPILFSDAIEGLADASEPDASIRASDSCIRSSKAKIEVLDSYKMLFHASQIIT